jgi:hypothetical protein
MMRGQMKPLNVIESRLISGAEMPKKRPENQPLARPCKTGIFACC